MTKIIKDLPFDAERKFVHRFVECVSKAEKNYVWREFVDRLIEVP